MGIRGPRVSWGVFKCFSVHIQWKGGSCKASYCIPHQRLGWNPRRKCLFHSFTLCLSGREWMQKFCREAVAWGHLQHPNILPLLGVTSAEGRLAMVSEWMENGNINDFIQKNPKANRTKLVSLILNCVNPQLTRSACRCCKWPEVYARPRDGPWRFERGAW